jgi:outer membrane protein assembly factor BamB
MCLGLWVLVGLAMAGQADWPHWRGPNHDGKSPDTGLLKEWPAGGPKRLWQVDTIGKGFSSVAVANGTVYITGDKDGKLVLFALGLDGKPKWKKDIDAAWTRSHPGSRATPTIDGDNLYLLSGNGAIVCLDAGSGAKKWAKNTRDFGGRPGGWGYAESVLVYKNLAICKPGGRNCIVAFDKATGEAKWQSTGFSAGPEYSSCLPVAVGKGHVIVTGTRAGLVCVNARNGEMLWSNSWSANNTANCPTPAHEDGYVFWANGYGKGGVCVKMEVADGKLVAKQAWTTKDMVCHHGGYVIHEGYIYGNHSGGWSCLELKTGKRMWNERGVGKGSLCWADGMLYLFGERNGKAGLATCSPQGMEMKGEFSVAGSGPSWAHPVVIGGRLYLRYDTNLYCFDVRAQ